jgi:DNA replication factor GINS
MNEEMNYKTLRKIQESEKKSAVLTDLKSNFYEELKNYLNKIEKRIESEKNNQKEMLLRDELSTVKKIFLNIYEQREKKIVLSAISKVRGGKPDISNILEIENEFYLSIIKQMIHFRKEIIKNNKKNNSEKHKIENKNKEKALDSVSNKNISIKKNPIVRVTENIPEFIGTDTKKYNLRKDDIISIPEDMCNTLKKRNVVEKLDV